MTCPECGGPVRSYRADDLAWKQCLYCPWIENAGAERQAKLVIHDADFDDLNLQADNKDSA